MINFRILLIFSFLYILSAGCDADKYFSSNLYSTTAKDSTFVEGRVLTRYSNQPIQNAQVYFGYYKSETDHEGKFKLLMLVNQDDNRNLTAPIIIRAQNYIDYYDIAFILPIPQFFEFRIKSRIPILKESALVFNNAEGGIQKVIQALVLDYEGTDNIDSVFSFLTFSETYDFFGNVSRPQEELEVPFDHMWNVDDTVAFFQSSIFERDIVHPRNKIDYPIIMIDKSGFKDTVVVSYYFLIPDDPIYPVDWGN